jgi:large conductance mechanosensitive channel
MIKAANKAMRKGPDAAGGPTEVELLTEIRDELKKR